MLSIVLVGNTHLLEYIEAIDSNSPFKLTGIFDPSFQFEVPKELKGYPIFFSFADVLENSQAIAFTSVENAYFPFIERAVQFSKPVFLHSSYYLSYEEHLHLIKLKDEARVTVQLYHPFIYHPGVEVLFGSTKMPLFADVQSCCPHEKNLLPLIRNQVSGILSIFGKKIKRVTANTFSTLSELPDLIHVRIDFNNGNLVNIQMNSIEEKQYHTLKVFGIETNHEINLTHNPSNDELLMHPLDPQSKKNLAQQMVLFFQNILNFSTPRNSLENECISFLVMEKVKEKYRVCIDV